MTYHPNDLRDEQGSCWDEGMTLPVREGECAPMPPKCELPHGHGGAHRAGRHEWMRCDSYNSVVAERDELKRERDDLQVELAKLIEVVRKVRAYADDRAFHSRRYNNMVNSGRIASDLYYILNKASLGSSTQWQYSYAEKWEDGSGVNERVTFDTEAKARQYFADNAPEVVEMNKYRESVGDPDRILPVLEKRRVVEPGDWLPLEAMTVDPSTNV